MGRSRDAGVAVARPRGHGGRDHAVQGPLRHLSERVIYAPIWANGFIRAFGSRVAEPALTLIPAFPYSAPYADVRLA